MLIDVIYSELKNSLSQHANYVVDTHNIYKNNKTIKSFRKSEHRNTLAIMAFTPRPESDE